MKHERQARRNCRPRNEIAAISRDIELTPTAEVSRPFVIPWHYQSNMNHRRKTPVSIILQVTFLIVNLNLLGRFRMPLPRYYYWDFGQNLQNLKLNMTFFLLLLRVLFISSYIIYINYIIYLKTHQKRKSRHLSATSQTSFNNYLEVELARIHWFARSYT